MDEIRTDSSEYKERFIAYCRDRGLAKDIAINEFDCWMEDAFETGDPESDAAESLSYYED